MLRRAATMTGFNAFCDCQLQQTQSGAALLCMQDKGSIPSMSGTYQFEGGRGGKSKMVAPHSLSEHVTFLFLCGSPPRQSVYHSDKA